MARLVNSRNCVSPLDITHNMLNEAYKKQIGDFYPSFTGINNKYVYFEGYVNIHNYEFRVTCEVPLSELSEQKIYRLPPSIGTRYAVYTFAK